MTIHKRSSRTNGHAGLHGRANGHAPASTEGGGIPMPLDSAASVDPRGASAAMGASCSSASGTVRAECAEAAPPPPVGALHGTGASTAQSGSRERDTDREEVPGGDSPLPLQPSDFVEEVHRRADLIISWVELVNSKDDKIRQRAIEKLTEMRYKGVAALADEPQQIVFDMPRPKRD